MSRNLRYGRRWKEDPQNRMLKVDQKHTEHAQSNPEHAIKQVEARVTLDKSSFKNLILKNGMIERSSPLLSFNFPNYL